MPVDSEIRARVEAFAADLIDLIKASALDVVHAALGQPQAGRRRSSFGGAAPGSFSAREKGAKRDPQELDALVERLSAFVIKNPGKRIEEIGGELAIATKELALPVKKLIAAKRITTKGQRRATTYYPAGARSAVRASEKPPKSGGRQAKTAKKSRKAGAKSKGKAKAGPARAKSKAAGRPRSKGAPPRPAGGNRAPKSTSGDAVASGRGKTGGGSAKPPANAEPSEQSSETASED
jgi:hypothetical protein